MSVLMAEMYNLGLARKEAGKILGDLPDFDTEDAILEFKEKQDKAKKDKGLEVINNHLDNVLGRVGRLLTDVGISPEMPQPNFEHEGKWGNVAFAFRPPSHYLEGEDEEDGPNAEAKAIAKGLFEAFASTAEFRDQLLMEILEWFANNETSVGDQAQNLLESQFAKRSKQESGSMEMIMEALENANGALSRLKNIGVAMFDDKDATQEHGARGMSDSMAARLNAKVRRTSMKLDTIPNSGRASAMKSIFIPHNLPDDLQSLQANIDEEDDEEQKLLDDLSHNWKDVCEEVRDTIIGVHELKIIKRSTKLAVRRVLYLFKLVAALLGRRTDEVKAKESAVIKMKAETSAYKSKLDHLHREAKTWREKLAVVQANNDTLFQERAALDNEVNALNSTLAEKEGIIIDLSEQIEAAATQKKTTTSPVDEFDSLSEGARRKITEMKTRGQMQEQRIVEMEEVLGEIATNLEQEKKEKVQEREKSVALEEELKETKTMLQVAEMRAQGIEELINEKSEKIEFLQGEIEVMRTDLQAKEVLVSKLTKVDVDEEDDPSAFLKRRGSIRRRNSVRRGSRAVAAKRSSSTLKDNESSGEMRKESENENVQLLAKPSREDSTGLQISSSRLQIKRSKSRLAIPVLPDVYDHEETIAPPAPSPQASLTAEIPTIEILPSCDSSPQVSPEPEKSSRLRQRRFTISAALVDRRSANVVSTKEYKRVVTELREAQKDKNELQKEIEELNKEFEEQEDRFEQMHLNVEKQHRIKMLLEEDKLKSGTGKLYSEYLKVENMLRRFKFDLSGTLEKALMCAAAKQAKDSYKHHAPVSPANFVESAQKTNEKFEGAFEIMMDAVNTSVATMQLSQRKMRRMMEAELGQMTVHHLQVLADKSRRIEDLQRKADYYRREMEEQKMRQQFTAKENIQLMYEVAEVEKIKTEVALKLQDYENDRVRSALPRSPFRLSPDVNRVQGKESFETLLHYAKEQQGKLKRRLVETEELLEKERANRARLENALVSRSRATQSHREDGHLAVTHPRRAESKQSGEPSDNLSAGTSVTERYVKTLRQIEEATLTSKKKLIDKRLLGRVKQVTQRWNACVTLRWIYIIKRYVKFVSYKVVLEEMTKDVINCGTPSQAGDLQACFWHIVRKKRLVVENKHFGNEVESLVLQCRHQVVVVFRQVGFAVIALKKTGILSAKIKPTEDTQDDDHPVPPSNSALSTASSISTISGEALTAGEENKSAESVAVDGQLQESEETAANDGNSPINTKQSIIRPTISTEHSTTTTNDGSGPQTAEMPSSELASAESGQIQDKESYQQEMTTEAGQAEAKEMPPFIEDHHKVEDDCKFNRKFFTRRLSTTCCSHQKQKPCDTAVPKKINFNQWVRRSSLPQPPPQRIPTSQSRRRISRLMNDNVICGIPRTLEMDIRQDLSKARKNLQQAMRRYSVTPDLQTPDPSLLTKKVLKQLRERRRTLAFLGIEKNEGLIARYDTSELIDIYKSRGSGGAVNPPSSASSESSVKNAADLNRSSECEVSKCRRRPVTEQCCRRGGASEANLRQNRSTGLLMEAKSSYVSDRSNTGEKRVSLQNLNQQANQQAETQRSRFNETVSSRRSSTN